MKVLVTGATGFIGSWVTERLVKKGLEVSILHRKTSDLSFLKTLGVTCLEGDLDDPESLKRALKGQKCVFHLGAYIGYGHRKLMEKINVEGTQNLLDAIKEVTQLERFVHFSSVSALGAGFSPSEILNEESPYNVGHLNLGYFDTKRKSEELVKNSGLNCVILNPSTVYGPRDSLKGSRKSQLKVAQGKLPFYTHAGVSIVHIEDVVSASIKAFETASSGERFILAGDNITIKELFETISDISQVKPPYIPIPTPVMRFLGKINLINPEVSITSTLYHYFDHSKARKHLNFKPRPYRQALEDSINWSRKENLI